jgi:hypothetical protein
MYVRCIGGKCVHTWATMEEVAYICELQWRKVHTYVGCSGGKCIHTRV